MKKTEIIPIACADKAVPRCADFDDECPDVTDKVACWLRAPEEGFCPYLQTEDPPARSMNRSE